MTKSRTLQTMAFTAIVPLALGATAVALADSASKDRRPTYGPIAELSWIKTPIGPDASPVSGDFSKGKHVTYLRFPGKFKTPVHTHTSDYIGIVLAGSAQHFVQGDSKTKVALHAGSYWLMPAGVKHVSECVSVDPCVFALIQDSKFDFLPVK